MGDNMDKYEYIIDGKRYVIAEDKDNKYAISDSYNYHFNKRNGFFARWGKNEKDDPAFSPVGGEILDIEITTICHGIRNRETNKQILCPFCYKSNTPNGKNMSFETFKKIIDKIPKTLMQVAFGSDSQATSNPDLWKMAEYCRSIGVVPNITVADISDETADKLSKVMGAVAVSRYNDKNVCYDSIKKLVDRKMTQINMHYMISENTYDACLETLKDIKTDNRLKGLNAIVLLSLKKKGRGTGFTSLSPDKYAYIVNYCLENNINFGMDSCGAKKFLDAVKDNPRYEEFKIVAEPCESTNFSQYCSVDGEFFPCSFCEGTEGWEKGIDMTCDNFDYFKDLWYNERVVEFRNKLNYNCNNCHKARECPIYQI